MFGVLVVRRLLWTFLAAVWKSECEICYVDCEGSRGDIGQAADKLNTPHHTTLRPYDTLNNSKTKLPDQQ